MALERTNTLAAKDIPDLSERQLTLFQTRLDNTHLALKVIVTREQQPAGDGESDGGDAAHRLANLYNLSASAACLKPLVRAYRVTLQLAVRTDIE